MPDESEGRWAIVQTVGDYYEHTSIRCFFDCGEAAIDRWKSYDESEQERREVQFIEYGETVSF